MDQRFIKTYICTYTQYAQTSYSLYFVLFDHLRHTLRGPTTIKCNQPKDQHINYGKQTHHNISAPSQNIECNGKYLAKENLRHTFDKVERKSSTITQICCP